MSLLAGPPLTLAGFRETYLLLLKSVLSVELRHSPRSLRHYKLRNALHVHEAFSSANNRSSSTRPTSYAASPMADSEQIRQSAFSQCVPVQTCRKIPYYLNDEPRC